MNLISKELLQAKNEPLNYFNKNSLIIIGIVVLGLFLYPFISPSKFALHLFSESIKNFEMMARRKFFKKRKRIRNTCAFL